MLGLEVDGSFSMGHEEQFLNLCQMIQTCSKPLAKVETSLLTVAKCFKHVVNRCQRFNSLFMGLNQLFQNVFGTVDKGVNIV